VCSSDLGNKEGELNDLLPDPESSRSKVRAAVRDIEIWDMQSRS
jgi:hypothetical protein